MIELPTLPLINNKQFLGCMCYDYSNLRCRYHIYLIDQILLVEWSEGEDLLI